MPESEGQNLQDYLTNLRDSVEKQQTQNATLESTVNNVHSAVENLTTQLNEQLNTLTDLHETQDHQIDVRIQQLQRYVSDQISGLTSELKTTIEILRQQPSSPALSVRPPPSTLDSIIPSPSLPYASSPNDASRSFSPRQTIIVQPPTAAPSFSGKADDRPRPFLLQLVQYTSSSYGWDKEYLFHNIGQFLKDTALEWYTQITNSANCPDNWDMFETLFLQQYRTPLRLAQTEQEWKKCTQKPNESINEFLVRLRSLWTDHKPRETERDLVRHLFTKARPELISLIGVLNEPTLKIFMERAREAEVIEFSRKKQASHNEMSSSHVSPATRSSNQNPPRNMSRSNITCFNCHTPGHLSTHCPYRQTPPYSNNSKN